MVLVVASMADPHPGMLLQATRKAEVMVEAGESSNDQIFEILRRPPGPCSRLHSLYLFLHGFGLISTNSFQFLHRGS